MNPVEEVKAQGILKPGDYGWWKVWGAQPKDIQPGDVVMVKGDEDWTEITGLFLSNAHPVRLGFWGEGGNRFTIGALCPVVVLRRGTHNMLA